MPSFDPDRKEVLFTMAALETDLTKFKTKKNLLAITLYPIWEMVPIIRNQIKKMLLLLIEDLAMVDNIVMTASELLENAVKYTTSDQIGFSIAYRHAPGMIELNVANRAKPGNIRQLLTIMKSMEQKDKQSFYLQKLREKHSDFRISHKGIARINYEAGKKIKVAFGRDKVVKIKIVFHL